MDGALGLDSRIWGGHLYTTATQRYFDEHNGSSRRVMMMGMADSAHPAGHRFPVWWTGDDKSLDYSIRSMVDYGVRHLKPFVHSDCGGNGNNETYIRCAS
jgi:hypothetical protein